ncbi:MAG: retropepsin-like domain-containing protein, partial [Deltaproteobacteria bacterium]|nr:retropepsin-like domain-containing protein [Deltaproteobacteria bacterium]
RKPEEQAAAPAAPAAATAEPSPPPEQEKKQATPRSYEVQIERKNETWATEVVLNGRVKKKFMVDTGASFCLIDWQTAMELDMTINEDTPLYPTTTASGVVWQPFVVLKSMQVGDAKLENVEVSIHNMPYGGRLLGNSFLGRFKMSLDAFSGKMELHPLEGPPSPDRPGGYGKDYWQGRFRFFQNWLEGLRYYKEKLRTNFSPRSKFAAVNNTLRYVENQLDILERRASSCGVPRNWRQ